MSSLQAPSSTVSHSFLLVAAQAWANKRMLSLLMSPALHQAPLPAEKCFPACPRWAREGIRPGEGGPHPAVAFCASGGLVKETPARTIRSNCISWVGMMNVDCQRLPKRESFSLIFSRCQGMNCWRPCSWWKFRTLTQLLLVPPCEIMAEVVPQMALYLHFY